MKNLSRSSIAVIILLFIPWISLCAQSEGATSAFEKHKESVIAYMSLGKEKEIIAKGTGFIIGKETMVTIYSLISQADKVEGLSFKGKKVKFDGSGSYDPDGTVKQYVWDFGDGTIQTTNDPKTTYSYTAEDIYIVTLTVKDDCGDESDPATTTCRIKGGKGRVK